MLKCNFALNYCRLINENLRGLRLKVLEFFRGVTFHVHGWNGIPHFWQNHHISLTSLFFCAYSAANEIVKGILLTEEFLQ